MASGTAIGQSDVFTIPIGMPRAFANAGTELAEACIVRGGGHPKPPRLVE